MIKRQTVLVLGAGANVHLGFPLGQELIKDIYRLVFDRSIGVKRISDVAGERFSKRDFLTNSQLLERFLELSDYKKDDGQKYTSDDIKEFAERLFQAQPPSVDFFLEKNPQYSLIGKLCIIFCISRYEDENSWQYLPSKYPNKLKKDFPDFGWYRYLWNNLIKGCKDIKDLHNNKVTIITFNYDRSLEYYLMRAIKTFFKAEEEEVMEVFNSIKIKHVYGRLGKFYEEINSLPGLPLSPEKFMLETAPYIPWDIACFYQLIGEKIEYGWSRRDFEQGSDVFSKKNRQFLVERFNKVIREIQTFDEANVKGQKEEFLKHLKSAKRIYFLGFGYHDENLKALGLPGEEGDFDFNKVRINGTAVNMTSEEARLITGRLAASFKAKGLHEVQYIKIQCSWNGLDKSELCLIRNFLRNVAPLS
ncbi:MAG: hypothetical protein P9L96_04260 [Candidatus Gygaella obscura]|nr:hypothetical protein [Candidatus Gygaella obscura]